MPLLELKDLTVSYGRIEAVRGISLTVEEGELVTLIGANGAGKTTTMRAISGIRPLSRMQRHRIEFQEFGIGHDVTRVLQAVSQKAEGRSAGLPAAALVFT